MKTPAVLGGARRAVRDIAMILRAHHEDRKRPPPPDDNLSAWEAGYRVALQDVRRELGGWPLPIAELALAAARRRAQWRRDDPREVMF